MRLSSLPRAKKSARKQLLTACDSVLEPLERRQLLSSVITAWNFNNIANGSNPNYNPIPSTGSGSASSIGMNFGNSADASKVVSESGNGTSSDGTSGNLWKIVGSGADSNGWNTSAPVASQGAQFLISTSYYQNIKLQFDWGTSSSNANGQLAVEYTLNDSVANPVWTDLTTGLSTNGDTGIAVLSNGNSSDTATVQGEYFRNTQNASNGFANALTADFSSVTGANNNPNFGVELVNAATDPDILDASGNATEPSNTSGNWRFDEVQIQGTVAPGAPTVISQPASQNIALGSSVTFTATALGAPAPISSQWYVSNNSGASYTPVGGVNTSGSSTTLASSNTYTPSATTSTPLLFVDSFSTTSGITNSSAASLNVEPAGLPTISTQPGSKTVLAGSSVTFTSAGSSPNDQSIQWYVSNNSGNSYSAIAGANSSSYTFTAAASNAGNQFIVRYTDLSGSINSSSAVLTVDFAPSVTVQPVTQFVTVGTTKVPFTASVSAAPAVTSVAWQTSSYSATPTWTNVQTGSYNSVSGTTYTSNYNVATATPALAGELVRAVFTNANGSTATNVNYPAAQLIVSGGTFSQWEFTSNVAETIESAQGQSDSDLISGDATTFGTPENGDAPYATYTANPYNASTGVGDVAQTLGEFNDYDSQLNFSGSDISNVVGKSTINPTFDPYAWRLRSNHSFDGWSQLAPEEASATIAGAPFTYDPQGALFKVNTTGYSSITLNFQWLDGGIADMQPQYSTDGGATWNNAGGILQNFSKDYPGITSSTNPPGYTVSLQGSQYAAAYNNPNFELRLVASYDPNLPQVVDGNAIEGAVDGGLTVAHGQYASSTPQAENAQQVIEIGGLPTAAANVNNVSGGTYQLSFGGYTTAAISWNAGPGGVQSALNALPSIGGVGGRVSVSQELLTPNAVNNNDEFLNITFASALADTPVSTITVASNSLTGTSPTVTVQDWVNGTATFGVDANGNEYGVQPFSDEDYLTAAGGGGWDLSDLSFSGLGFNSTPTVLTGPQNQTIAESPAAGHQTVTFTATAYNTGTITAQWQENTGSGWMNVSSGGTNYTAGTSTYNYSSATDLSDNGYQFRAVFINSAGSSPTVPATLTAVTPVSPVVTTQPLPVSVQVGYGASFTAYATTGSPTPTVQWQTSTGSTWSNVANSLTTSGATSNTLSVQTNSTEIGSGTQYRAVFTNIVSVAVSNPATLTVLSPETTIADWNFNLTYPGVSIAKSSPDPYINNPAPYSNVSAASITAIGFSIPYNPNDPASGTGPGNTFNADDIVASAGAANPGYIENTWRPRGGPSATSGGSPANGWSNFAEEYTQGAQFAVDTTGYNNVYVTMDLYATTSSELNFRQQYTTDGVNWYNLDDGQLAWNGTIDPNTGLDNLDPNDPYAPLDVTSNDYLGATATISSTAITSLSISNDQVTIGTTNTNGAYYAGETVSIANVNVSNSQIGGQNNSLFNGTFTILSANSSGFTYALANGSSFSTTTFSGSPSASLGGFVTPLVFNLTGIAGATNNPKFAVRVVSAYAPQLGTTFGAVENPTFTGLITATHGFYAVASSAASPTAYPGSAGNWRFGNIVFHATAMTPAWLSPGSSTYTWSSTTETLTITSGTATIIGDPAASGDSPVIDVSGASSNLIVDSTTTNTVHIGGLNLSGGATMSITAGTTDILIVHSGGTFSIAPGSTLNLNNNFVDLVNGGSAGLSAVDALLATGYNNGTWTGTGITSSNAAGDGTHLTTVGAGIGLTALFDGITPSASDVLLRYTYYGDANLNGSVDGSDYSLEDFAALNGLSGATGWVDFNNDGVINGSDYTLLDNAYNTQGPQLLPSAQIARKIPSSSVFAGGIPISSVDSISDFLKKDRTSLLSAGQDIIDALNIMPS